MANSRARRLLFAWLVAVCCCGEPVAAWPPRPAASRAVTVRGVRGQPDYSLLVSANGAQGRIEVLDATGSHVQDLSCALLRDESAPTSGELEAVREQFVSHFETEDLNFDGYADLKAPREFGAKWAQYCVWLFDPVNHGFVRDSLALQMELLYNLRADPKRGLVLASSIGPEKALLDEYRIENPGGNRPYWPRLIPVRSCFIDNNSRPAIAVVTEYDRAQPEVTRKMIDGIKGRAEACEEGRSGRDR